MTDLLSLIAGLGTGEMIAILIIILVIFGPTQLPKIGRALGGGIKEFKDGLKTGMDDEPPEPSPPPARTSVTALPPESPPGVSAPPQEQPQETPRH